MKLNQILFAAGLLIAAAFVSAQSTTGTQTLNVGAANAATSAVSPAAVTPKPLEPTSSGEPYTEMLDTANSPAAYDPLLEPRPLPHSNLSLLGGIVRKVDVMHNRITLQPFGGGSKYSIYFDERTHILSGGREATVLAIHPGQRVYADTQNSGAQVFARTIQVRTAGSSANANGQVVEVLGGQLRMLDRLSGETIRVAITDRTRVQSRRGPVAAGDLHSGSLIEVTFFSNGRPNEAQNITIYANPGESYVFAGILSYINLRDGILALDNQVDGKNYELYFDPLGQKKLALLTVGTAVSATASFDGKRYRATSIKVRESAAKSESSNR
ncbi:MAG: hypothetical protein CXZ00_06750 [Acidobacteria bacterium]|mgnify:CR=1 FL=1|nr:MAG: hypothetical protein CXZ00_06750 [Acidobacteriota bacterium]